LQDCFLTFAAGAAEADSFGASGLGMKRPGIQRYFKREALLTNTMDPADLVESGLRAGWRA
jgi:hypothetical protein